jgi:hypothetical protein
LAHLACWPNRPAGPPSPPGWAKPAGSGLGQPTQPDPSLASPSLTLELAGDLDRLRRRPAIPADPGDLHRRRLDRMIVSTSSSNTSSWISRILPLRGDLDGVSSLDPPPPIASGPVLLPASSPLLAVHPLVLELRCNSPVEVP